MKLARGLRRFVARKRAIWRALPLFSPDFPPPQIRAISPILALTKGRCFVTFTKVTLSPFLAVPKKKAPLHGARESPLLVSATKIHPVRPNLGRLTVETVRKVSPIFWSKKVSGVARHFSSKLVFAQRTEVRPSPPHSSNRAMIK